MELLPTAVPPTAADTPADEHAARLAEELADSWRHGNRCRAEDLLAEHPELRGHPRALLRLIYEEICQRQELGLDIDPEELYGRFPAWRRELGVLLQCHRLLDLGPHATQFPQTGEILGEFRLVAELGRGALGRVFLAEETFLAGRLMVVKVTPCTGHEHLALARLQHTHIVPLYGARDFPERNLRVLSMPCLGGTTLDRLLRHLESIAPAQRTGDDLRRALRESLPDPHMGWPGRGSSWQYLERASCTEALCWIGLCIAEALHHAHEQGLVHLDLKPSNILLTADGQPMLLDFHLARGPVAAGTEALDWMGGTPPYMSPEQRATWRALRQREAVPATVDGRSDIYSLGLLLAEALGGGPTGAAPDTPPLAGRELGHLPAGLRDILARALQPNAAARYATAAALAEDLRRHLTDRPLIGVRNRSLQDRWAKWRRRRPHTLTVVGLLLAVAAAVASLAGVALVHARQQLAEAQTELTAAQAHLNRRAYAEALLALERGAPRTWQVFGSGDLAHEFRRLQARAARGLGTAVLHARVQRLRYHFADTSLSVETLRTLEAGCREAWEERTPLVDLGAPRWAADEEDQLRTDLLDLAVLWSDFRTRLATPAELPEARRGALEVLAEAERLFGPSAALTHARRGLGERVDDPGPAPRTAWEHYTVGRALLRDGDYAGAAAALDRAVALQPRDFWPWFWTGQCAFRQGRHHDAVTAFTACVALAPDSAECYHNRAMAQAARGQITRALADYDHALALDPTLAAAALNRGVLHLLEKRLEAAASDLTHALERGANPAMVQYNLALVHLARHDRAAALTCVDKVLRYQPDHREALSLRQQLKRGKP
jgi:serine/threonine protein kinase/Flp pilus assembly protein TadD